MQWFIKDAVRKGTPLIVVDPLPNELTKMRPAGSGTARTDGALALGILNIIISEELYDKDFVENWTVGFQELKNRVKEYPHRVSEITWVPGRTSSGPPV